MTLADLLGIMPNLGVGIGSLVVIYFVFKMVLASINARDKAFKDFVENHSNKSIEVMTECRDAIHTAAENIRSSSEIQKMMIEHLSRVKQ